MQQDDNNVDDSDMSYMPYSEDDDVFEPTRPDIILWDWDNTLVDSWGIIHECLNATYREYGLPEWTEDQTKNRVHQSLEEAFPPIFGDAWKEAGAFYRNMFESLHIERLTPLEDARTTLDLCNKLGIVSAVVSNKLGKNLRKEVQHLGWNDDFVAVVGASDAANDKPSPDHAYMALEKCGIADKKHVWFIGDSSSDILCAAAIKAQAVLYGEGTTVPEAILEEVEPYIHVYDHVALQQVLEAFTQEGDEA